MNKVEQLIADVDARFVSGNDIPVSRTTLTAEAWEMIRECLQEAVKYNRYNKNRFDFHDGLHITTHINVGVNVWRGEHWLDFHEVSPEEFEEIIAEIEKEKNNAGISA